jgi:hypothetical protein
MWVWFSLKQRFKSSDCRVLVPISFAAGCWGGGGSCVELETVSKFEVQFAHPTTHNHCLCVKRTVRTVSKYSSLLVPGTDMAT